MLQRQWRGEVSFVDMAKLGRMVEQTQTWLTDEDIARIADTCDESAGCQASRPAAKSTRLDAEIEANLATVGIPAPRKEL